jgi:TrmH family RNA methyltransferase
VIQGADPIATLTPLSKTRFNRFRALHSRKERQQTGLTLLEGETLVAEALEHGARFTAVLGLPEFWGRRPDWIRRLGAAGVAAFTLTPKQLEMLAVTEHSAGSLAVVARPEWKPELLWKRAEQADFLGVLGIGLQDPGNVGGILRTLAAAAGQGAWLSEGCAELASPKVMRASAGAVLRLPGIENAQPAEVIAGCRQRGIQTLATVVRGGRTHTSLDLTLPTLLVLGAEGEGLPESVQNACDYAVHIPMPGGMESLNVAVAGGIILYEAVRQRRLAPAGKRGSEGERSMGSPARGESGADRAGQGHKRTRGN